jgi:hypothetical protein
MPVSIALLNTGIMRDAHALSGKQTHRFFSPTSDADQHAPHQGVRRFSARVRHVSRWRTHLPIDYSQLIFTRNNS